jgi:hypothetical protein
MTNEPDYVDNLNLKASWYYTPYALFKFKRKWYFCMTYDKTFRVWTFRLLGITRGYYPYG